MTRTFVALVAGSLVSAGAYAATLDKETQSKVRAATFEIVMKKPEHDSLVYERPLPLDLLPYIERTDKYVSIGTAFAIAPNEFVTAAHVIEQGFVTQYGQPALRDRDGAVHEIDQILKYSMDEDFAVFSVRNPPPTKPLEPNREPAIDETVFAVGNALGEGVVVRDGLLTSRTPEDRDGRWKWLRFSAAASPGNSGGPLLDSEGRVLGVVLQKSPNENLNYAAPIDLVLNAPEKMARLEGEFEYWLPVMSISEAGLLKAELQLPLPYDAFAKAWVARTAEHAVLLKRELLRKHSESIFPKGQGARPLLFSSFSSDAISIVARKDDGAWEFFYGSQPAVTQLHDNGYVAAASVLSTTVLKIRRPDSAPVEQFYSDSDAYMQAVLKALPWKRQVGREEVRVVSMGKAKKETLHTDDWGRIWQFRTWTAEYQDAVAISAALPTPDGYLAIVSFPSTAEAEEAAFDLRVLTSFSHIALSGSLKQWDEYLQLTQFIPEALRRVQLQHKYGESLSIRSPRFDMRLTEQQQKIGPDSELRFGFSFFEDADRVVWDLTGVGIVEDLNGRRLVILSRHPKPPEGLRQEYTLRWAQMMNGDFPFDGKVVESNGRSLITAIYSGRAAAKDPQQAAYQVAIVRAGKHAQEEMQAALEQTFSNLSVREP